MSSDKRAVSRVRPAGAARQREAAKAAILQSVTRIIAEEGADALTIDEVARSAAMSKGGVLHHFPSKEALLLAAIRHDLDLFDETVARLQSSDPAMPGAYTRAYLRACAESYGQPCEEGLAARRVTDSLAKRGWPFFISFDPSHRPLNLSAHTRSAGGSESKKMGWRQQPPTLYGTRA